MTDLGYSDPPEQKQMFAINHIVRADLPDHTGAAWLKSSGVQKHLAARISQGLRVHVPATSQGPVLKTDLPLACAGFEHFWPIELTLSYTVLFLNY